MDGEEIRVSRPAGAVDREARQRRGKKEAARVRALKLVDPEYVARLRLYARDYYRNRRDSGTLTPHRVKYQRKTDELSALVGFECRRCGNYDPRVLAFHHVNGDGAADRGRGRGRTGSLNYLRRMIRREQEAPGSIIRLCANCHLIVHCEDGGGP